MKHYKKLLAKHYADRQADQYWIRNPNERYVTLHDLDDTIPPTRTVNLLDRLPGRTLKDIENSESLKERLDSGVLVRVYSPPSPFGKKLLKVNRESIPRPNRSSITSHTLPIDKELQDLYTPRGSLDRPAKPEDEIRSQGPALTASRPKNKPSKYKASVANQETQGAIPKIVVPKRSQNLCHGLTKSLKPCGYPSVSGSKFCALHKGQDVKEMVQKKINANKR